ncbi:MAG: hypothetical protein LUC19_00880 [Oscillospiraceae bacterium]|nr:hypothetical protein [Oscillospiraceae bacterium]
MSKYNYLATKLNRAFMVAAEETNAALENFKEASEKKQGGYISEMKYIQAQERLDRVKSKTWPEFWKIRDELTAELKSEIAADGVLSPDSVDDAGLAILNSGICSVDDIEALFQRYKESDNITMLRFVGSAASKLASDTRDRAAAERLNVIARNSRGDNADLQNKWNSIVGASRVYSSESHPDYDVETISRMASRWSNVQSALADF